jgi:hypothetical protein
MVLHYGDFAIILKRDKNSTLKLSPSGLGSGIEKDRPDYTVYCGQRAVGRDPRGPRERELVLVAECQRSCDARGPRGDFGRGQGAVSEELGHLEGVGEVEEVP